LVEARVHGGKPEDHQDHAGEGDPDDSDPRRAQDHAGEVLLDLADREERQEKHRIGGEQNGPGDEGESPQFLNGGKFHDLSLAMRASCRRAREASLPEHDGEVICRRW
jgi:hypothetical protein